MWRMNKDKAWCSKARLYHCKIKEGVLPDRTPMAYEWIAITRPYMEWTRTGRSRLFALKLLFEVEFLSGRGQGGVYSIDFS
jgi:hypothetical protein